MISVIIPFKNDFSTIEGVLHNVYLGIQQDDLEIILVNDGSKHTNTRFRPIEPAKDFSLRTQRYVKVINNPMGYGVGYSFDRGAEIARGDILVLMGADVFPRSGWDSKVKDAVQSNPNTLGCATCIGLNPDRKNLDDPKNKMRYGADLLFTYGPEDTPKGSGLRDIHNFSNLFRGRWRTDKVSDSPCDIPCLMGAFYFTSREYYRLLAGWDTRSGNHWRGHRAWGHLEPYISLKSWLVGGGCTLYPDIQAGHVFARITDRTKKWDGGVRNESDRYWNQLFMLETMIMDTDLQLKLNNFLKPRKNLGIARKWIKQHYDTIEQVRAANSLLFKNTPEIFTEKFGYKLD
jgi:glycosyltransferase involved in cell wall biosynthesis